MKGYRQMTRSKAKMKEFCQHIEKRFDEKLSRTLHGLQAIYHNQREIQRVLKKENPLIYEIFIARKGGVKYGLTVLKPGKIGKEYYMTHGYKNKKPHTERCILVEGKGKLILQGKNPKIIDLEQGKTVLIPKNNAHRLVNTGNKILKVLKVSNSDSEHLAITDFRKKVFIEE